MLNRHSRMFSHVSGLLIQVVVLVVVTCSLCGITQQSVHIESTTKLLVTSLRSFTTNKLALKLFYPNFITTSCCTASANTNCIKNTYWWYNHFLKLYIVTYQQRRRSSIIEWKWNTSFYCTAFVVVPVSVRNKVKVPINYQKERLKFQSTTINQLVPINSIQYSTYRPDVTNTRQLYTRTYSAVDPMEIGSNFDTVSNQQQQQRSNRYDENTNPKLRPRSDYMLNYKMKAVTTSSSQQTKSSSSSSSDYTNYQYDAQQIKNQVDIISIIESYQLDQFQRTSGSSSSLNSRNTAVACCPFHNDRNPSFKIIDDPLSNLRMYQCFSCGAAGDVFKFVKDYNNLYNTEMNNNINSNDDDNNVYDNVPIDDVVITTTNIDSKKKGIFNNQPKQQQQLSLNKYKLMTYGQAVRHVWDNYVTTKNGININKKRTTSSFQGSDNSNYQSNGNWKDGINSYYHQQRIILANIAAASYYCECLRQPSAGNARYYLRQRGISISSITEHSIGYAPDCYYSYSSSVGSTTKLTSASLSSSYIHTNGDNDTVENIVSTKKWGDGSLVHRLRQLGFTPTEIIDSGLAVRTKRFRPNTALVDKDKSTRLEYSRDSNMPQDHATTINDEVTIHLHPNTTITTNLVNNTLLNDIDDISNGNKSNNITNDDDNDYSTLIDRFRDRIIVPIFDSKGENVLGFGGRVVDVPQEENIDIEDTNIVNANVQGQLKQDADHNLKKSTSLSSSFVPPKYINSPESIIFEKRRILYGQYLAKQELATITTVSSAEASAVKKKARRKSQSPPADESSSTPYLVIVEGYMDAIVLRAAGIRNVVATMGTSISLEQLLSAANTLLEGTATRMTKDYHQHNQQQKFDGIHRIVLCLDNDNAGIAATERICSNSMILDTIRQCTEGIIDFYIAPSFNSTIKDPAEYIDCIVNDGTVQGVKSKKKNKKSVSVSDIFQKDIVSQSIHWLDWYLERIVQRYNPVAPFGTLGSISDIMERCSTLIAQACTHPSDRIPKVTSLANTLATLLTNTASSDTVNAITNRQRNKGSQDIIDSDETSASVADKVSQYNLVVEQLQIDLTDRVSHNARIHRSNEVLRSRELMHDDNEDYMISSDTSVKSQWKDTSNVMIDLANGAGPESRFDTVDHQMTSRAKKEFFPPVLESELFDNEFLPNSRKMKRRLASSTTEPKQRQRIVRPKSLADSMKVDSITPHFSGFSFTHKSDMEWLNIYEDKQGRKNTAVNNLVLGYKPMTNADRQMAKQRGYDHISAQASGLNENLVYFNSVEYNGKQFLSEDAAVAGYRREGTESTPSQSIIETGIAALVEPDIANILFQGESALLQLLVRNVAARATTKNLMEARNLLNLNRASNYEGIIWSSYSREWLFRSLIGMNENLRNYSLPSGIEELRLLLSNAVDVPPNAFIGNATSFAPTSNDDWKYSVDCFFSTQFDENDDLAHTTEIHLDLHVQELCATLFWASSAQNAKQIRQGIAESSKSNVTESHILLPAKSDHGSIDNLTIAANIAIDKDTLHDAIFAKKVELAHTKELLGKLTQANKLWYSSANSMKKVTARLMDEGSTLGRLEGKMSVKTQTDLYAKLDAFLEQHDFAIPESQSSDLDYLFQKKDVDEPYDVALERMQKEFGDWYDDEYVWSPDHSQSAVLPSIPFLEYDDEDEEPIEVALQRIEREWGQPD